MPNIGTKSKSVVPGRLETELTNMDAGILKDVPVGTSLTINGQSMTQPQIDGKLKSFLGTIQAADAAKQQYQTALEARRNMQLEARDFFLQLKKVIVGFFGAKNPLLADFGLKAAKAVVRTAKTSVLAKAKGDITRAARGTKTKKQKAAIQPNQATPAVGIGSDGTLRVIPPTVVNPEAPGAAASGTGGSSGSTPAVGSSGAPGGNTQQK